MIMMLTNQIKYKGQNENGKDFINFFPEFSWVLRDFSFGFKDMTTDQYLERCLDQERGTSDDILQKNSIRLCLKKFFPKIECYSMIRPLHDG